MRAIPTDAPRQFLLEELDSRQDELLNELDQLNERIEQVLTDCLRWHRTAAGSPLPAAA